MLIDKSVRDSVSNSIRRLIWGLVDKSIGKSIRDTIRNLFSNIKKK